METTSGRKVVGGKWPKCEEIDATGDDEPGSERNSRGASDDVGPARKVDWAQNDRSKSRKQ
jgi:hypothetical protein